MKHFNIFACALVAFYIQSNLLCSQNVFEDAKGDYSIVLNNSNLAFNFTDTRLSAGYFYSKPNSLRNLNTPRINRNCDTIVDRIGRRFFGGFQISGNNAEGNSLLIDSSRFVLQGEGRVTFGIRGYFSNTNRFEIKRSLERIAETLARLRDDLSYYSTIKSIEQSKIVEDINKLKAILSSTTITFIAAHDKNSQELLLNQLTDYVKTVSYGVINVTTVRGFITNFRSGINFTTTPSTQSSELNSLLTSIDNHASEIARNEDLLAPVADSIRLISNKKDRYCGQLEGYDERNSYRLYISGGLRGKEFTLMDSTLLNLEDKTHIGPFIRLGMNVNLKKNWLLGLSMGYSYGDNYDRLKKVSYETQKIIFQDSVTTSKTTKKIDGVTGLYYQYHSLDLLLDAVKFFNIENKFTLCLNGYYRGNFVLDNQDNRDKYKLIDQSTIGIGIYGFNRTNSVFTGGIYCELFDLANNSQSQGTVFNRMRIGLVTRINLLKFRFDRTYEGF